LETPEEQIMRHTEYHRPRSLEEALRLRQASPDARYIAGGTDVMVQIRSRNAARPSALVSLSSIPELRGITVDGGARIGATTPIHELTAHRALRERYPVLVEAVSRLGSPQIRNVATLGGNLCNASPCADSATPLLVLEARVRLCSAAGQRELPLERLFLGAGQTCLAPSELLTEILLPPPAPTARATFKKKGRVRMDLALASVSVLVELDGDICRRVRIAAGSVAPTPLRLTEVEVLLAGKPLSPELLDAAAALASRSVAPISDLRCSAEYRRQIVGVYVKRALEELRPAARSRA
jgi:CO/xanthine dehydrogenase FAD-binding subunit